MRRTVTTLAATLLALSMMATAAAAAPTQARNYEALPATCEVLGEIVIEVVGMGMWATGKVQGTRLTLIPRSFAFSGTNVDTGEEVFPPETLAKRNAQVDDVCTITFLEEVEGDPELPDGTYLFEAVVGLKIVGPRR